MGDIKNFKSFSSDELKIVQEDENFIAIKRELDDSLEKIHNGTVIFYSTDEVEAYLDKMFP